MKVSSKFIVFACCVTIFCASTDAQTSNAEKNKTDRETPFVVRPFKPITGKFVGNGISYGPYRKGQRPGEVEPKREQIQQDMRLLAGDKWQMIRTYGTEPFMSHVCEIIKLENLPLKVMVGAWVATASTPEQKQANDKQVNGAIELANKYPDIVAAVSVGNESQVFWSFHKVKQETLIAYIRDVRSKIKQPVTVADDFKFWNSDESQTVAKEIDFIVSHMYAMWLGQTLKDSVQWTQSIYADVKKNHPNRKIIIGELGWATKKANHGDQGKMIKGKAGEAEQKVFFESITKWLKQEEIGYFYFEAFDEPWKGGDDPGEVEKHWGLFREDRTRKPAIQKS